MSRFGWHTLIITIVIMTTYRIESSSFDRTNVIIDHRSLMDKFTGWYFFKEPITANSYTKAEKEPQMVNSEIFPKFEKDHTSEFEKHSQTVEAKSNSKEKDQLAETGRLGRYIMENK